MKKNIIIIIILLIAVVLAFYFIIKPRETAAPTNENTVSNNSNNTNKMDEVKIEVLQQGQGAETKNGDVLTVNYVGTLENGTKFDSSIDRNQPFSFTLGAGQVIQGWDQGLVGMKIGEKRRLTIPASLGYGDRNIGTIPANSTLIFEVDLLKIN